MVSWDVSKERGRVLQLFTHVNSGMALHVTRRGGVGFGVQDRRLLANTHWPSTTNNTEGTRQFLDQSIMSVNMSLNMSVNMFVSVNMSINMFVCRLFKTVYRHVHRLFTECLQSCLQTVYRLFTGILQDVYRLFTDCL